NSNPITSMVILSVLLTTLSPMAARIYGIRFNGMTVASRLGAASSNGALSMPGSERCQRSSAATAAESEPSAISGSSCGNPGTLVVGAPAGACGCARSTMYGLAATLHASAGATGLPGAVARIGDGADPGAEAAVCAAGALSGGAEAGVATSVPAADVDAVASGADAEGTLTLSARSASAPAGAASFIRRMKTGSRSESSSGRSSLR